MLTQDRAKDQLILVADDEVEILKYLETVLKCQGYAVEVTRDGNEAIDYLKSRKVGHPVDAVLLDLIMPGKHGLATLKEIRNIDPDLPVLMVSGAATPQDVLEAMRCGASDFIGKPVNHEDLRRAISRAIDKRVPRDGTPRPASPPMRSQIFFGNTPKMRELEALADQIGGSEATVLIRGETGVGKEVLARHLHSLSPRSNLPFLKLNCAALPSELVESELFGYEKGAFTGAFQKKPGMFELADGGTILLDEIGDMDFKLQAKLLQVLQDSEFQRVGGKETIRVDVRVMAATHADLEAGIKVRTFREDLYYRLNVINLQLLPLRERKEDIIPLAALFLRKHSSKGSRNLEFNKALNEAMLAHQWPGNIRELENVMRKFVVLGDPDLIASELRQRSLSVASVPKEQPAESSPILEQVTKAKQHAESEAILAALDATRWNRKHAAKLLKIDYKALLYKMKKLGIEDKLISISNISEETLSSDDALCSAGSLDSRPDDVLKL
jgi:two-component system response regulator AtoC